MRNFFILIFLLLTGCSGNTCITDYKYDSESEYGGNFCIKDFVYNSLKEEGKSDTYIFDVATYSYEMDEMPFECHSDNKQWTYEDWFLSKTMAAYNNRELLSEEGCLISWKESELKYIKYIENENKKQKELEIAEEKFRQKKKKYEQKLKQKSGVDWCIPRSMYFIIQQLHGNLAKNCMFELETGELRVLQQTSDGTLVHTTLDSDFIYLIKRNNKDSQLVDNAYIDGGIFVNIGKYQYTNVLGSLKTIYKLKRIE